MLIASALSTAPDTDTLAADLSTQLLATLGDARPDLLTLYLTANLQDHAAPLSAKLRDILKPRATLGCTAEGVVAWAKPAAAPPATAAARELESGPAVAALALSAPGITLDTFHFAEEEWPELLGEPGTLRNRLDAGDDLRAFIMLGDPFTVPIVQLLARCNDEFPAAPVIGGMASGMTAPGQARLIRDEHIHSSGLVGVSIAGNLEVDCVVSQGCRPIGETHVITRATGNVIHELNGETALAAIESMIATLSLEERLLLQSSGLQLGRVIDEGKGSYGSGDFLVRSLLNVDRGSGAIAVGDLLRPGQTVQFHVRDARAAAQDLRLVLEGEMLLAKPPAGAMVFTCAGRGTRLFEEPHHDISLIEKIVGPVPAAGLFCAGEFGPVAQKSFVHTYTVSLALFRPVGG